MISAVGAVPVASDCSGFSCTSQLPSVLLAAFSVAGIVLGAACVVVLSRTRHTFSPRPAIAAATAGGVAVGLFAFVAGGLWEYGPRDAEGYRACGQWWEEVERAPADPTDGACISAARSATPWMIVVAVLAMVVTATGVWAVRERRRRRLARGLTALVSPDGAPGDAG